MRDVVAEPSENIRGVLIPLHGMQLLLPNAAVAEVINYSEPEKLKDDKPTWLLGSITWRQRELFVMRLETLLQHREMPAAPSERIIVCHTLDLHAKHRFVGIVAESIPHLVPIQKSVLKGQALNQRFAQGLLHASLSINGVDAYIPHLQAIEQRIAEVV